MKLSICIPTYNRLPHLKRCLNSIFEGFKDYPYEVIIADGGSTDGTLEYLRNLDYDNVKIIEQGKLTGAIKAFNACFKVADGDYVFFGNDDFALIPEVFIKCCKLMDKEKRIGIVAPKLKEIKYGGLPGVTVKKYWTLLSKVCIFRHSVLKEVNYFDESFRTYYIDDDSFLSVIAKGYTTIFSRDVGIIHYRVEDEDVNEARAINQDIKRVTQDWEYLKRKWFNLEKGLEEYLRDSNLKKYKSMLFTFLCNKIYSSRVLRSLVPKGLYDWFLEQVVVFKDRNYSRLKDFYLAQKYSETVIESVKINSIGLSKKIQLLKDVKKVLDKHKIEFLPLHATLLGFVRQNGIMPWDPDIDLGIWYHDYDRVLEMREELEKLGYKLLHGKGRYSHVDICYAEDYDVIKRGVRCIQKYDEEGWYYDVYFHIGIDFLAKDKDKIIILQFFDKNIFNRIFGKFRTKLAKKSLSAMKYNLANRIFNTIILYMRKHKVYSYSWFEKTETRKIYDLDIKIPVGYEKYLEQTYGKNWRIPVGTNRNYPGALKRRKTRALKKHKIKDKKIRNLWIKRGDVVIDL